MRLSCALLLCCLSAAPAGAASISLTVSGTVFEGGPAFLLEADSYPVGVGIVPRGDANYLFTYAVDDAILDAASSIRIRVLNDRFVEGVGDRNLRVVSLVVNGLVLSGDALSTFLRNDPVASPGDMPSTDHQVRIARPVEGWPQR